MGEEGPADTKAEPLASLAFHEREEMAGSCKTKRQTGL